MTTTRTTLVSEADSVLARMFGEDSTMPPAKVEGGEYFLDADPDAFKVILGWLRHRHLVLPPSVPREAVAALADFYCLAKLLEMVQPSVEVLSRLVLEEWSGFHVDMSAAEPSEDDFEEVGEEVEVDETEADEAMDEVAPQTAQVQWWLRIPVEDCHRGKGYGVPKIEPTEQRTVGKEISKFVGIDNDQRLYLHKRPIVGDPCLRLYLHPLECFHWTHCTANTIPPNALSFEETAEKQPKYLGFFQEGKKKDPVFWLGVAAPGLGIQLSDGRQLGTADDKFYVMTAQKK